MWFAPCIVCFMCGKGKVEIEAWDNALRKWQMDFNQQVTTHMSWHERLEPKIAHIRVTALTLISIGHGLDVRCTSFLILISDS